MLNVPLKTCYSIQECEKCFEIIKWYFLKPHHTTAHSILYDSGAKLHLWTVRKVTQEISHSYYNPKSLSHNLLIHLTFNLRMTKARCARQDTCRYGPL